ncbi:MAG: DUF4249 domain-containing protein [Prolixibacteraceae bacterium]
MKTIKIIYTALIFALVLNACSKKISFDADLISSKLVINGIIEPDSLVDLVIATSKPIPGTISDFIWLPNATVVLYEDGNKVETLETYDLVYAENDDQEYNYNYNYSEEKRPAKAYRSKLRTKAGSTYRLEITHPDYESVSCETTIPEPVEIISIDTSSFKENQHGYERNVLKVELKFKDPENEPNYYRMIAHVLRGEPTVNYNYETREYTDTVVNVTETYANINDPIINPENEDANDILFNSPSNRYNVFTDELIDGKEYTITFKLEYYVNRFDLDSITENMGAFYNIDFILQAISRETYLYYKSSYEHKYYDGELFVEPVQVFSNVENGIGIFGATSGTSFSYKDGEYPIDGVIYQQGNYYNYYY